MALRWTAKSLINPAGELKAEGHAVSVWLEHRLLDDSDYSLMWNLKVPEGSGHPSATDSSSTSAPNLEMP
jgi:hypothetical protein